MAVAISRRSAVEPFHAMDVLAEANRLKAAGHPVVSLAVGQPSDPAPQIVREAAAAALADGRIGYTGGAAVGDKWLGDVRNEDEWRDSMVRVTGCLAENLQSAFSELWAFSTGEVLTGDSFFPDNSDSDGGRYAHVRSLGIISSPSSEEHPLRLFFFLSFLTARRRLWITSPYFVPDKHLRSVVARRARAGVDVRILLPNEHTDAKPIRWASHSYYSELLDAGVKIYEYQPAMMHNKLVVVDSTWAIVGSANMDIRSKELNEENVLGILEPEFAEQVERSFELGRRQPPGKGGDGLEDGDVSLQRAFLGGGVAHIVTRSGQGHPAYKFRKPGSMLFSGNAD